MRIKKFYFSILFILVVCVDCKSQQAENEVIVCSSMGYSTMKVLIALNPIENPHFAVNSGWYLYSGGEELPSYNASFDWGINERYSIGGGVAYQEIDITSEKISRLNIGLRLLDHFNKERNTWNGRLDEYIGLRPGISFWEDKGYSNNEPILFKPSFALPSIQFLIGMRMYPLPNFAIQIEGAIGSPYFINIGVLYRINHTSTTTNSKPNN